MLILQFYYWQERRKLSLIYTWIFWSRSTNSLNVSVLSVSTNYWSVRLMSSIIRCYGEQMNISWCNLISICLQSKSALQILSQHPFIVEWYRWSVIYLGLASILIRSPAVNCLWYCSQFRLSRDRFQPFFSKNITS